MCAMCDGATLEEFLEDLHDLIDRHGFTVSGIEPDEDHPTWLYTIGLLDRVDHPELCILGVPLGFGVAVLNKWGNYVLDGNVLAAGETIQSTGICYADDETTVIGDVTFHVGEVDERLWHGEMFNGWHDYYRWLGGPAPPPHALELRLCGNQPDPFLPPSRRRRAIRRAQLRWRHRRG
jgi:hypothetical protein